MTYIILFTLYTRTTNNHKSQLRSNITHLQAAAQSPIRRRAMISTAKACGWLPCKLRFCRAISHGVPYTHVGLQLMACNGVNWSWKATRQPIIASIRMTCNWRWKDASSYRCSCCWLSYAPRIRMFLLKAERMCHSMTYGGFYTSTKTWESLA